MLIYNIKTQVKFVLGYNPLIFMDLWAFYKNIAHLAGASVSNGHISSLQYNQMQKKMKNLCHTWVIFHLANKIA